MATKQKLNHAGIARASPRAPIKPIQTSEAIDFEDLEQKTKPATQQELFIDETNLPTIQQSIS